MRWRRSALCSMCWSGLLATEQVIDVAGRHLSSPSPREARTGRGASDLLRVLNLSHTIKLPRARVLRSRVLWPYTALPRAGPRRLFRNQCPGPDYGIELGVRQLRAATGD